MPRLLVAILCLPLMGQQHGNLPDGDAKPKHPDRTDREAVQAGRKLFSSGCAACHGGEAQGGRGPNLRKSLQSDDLKDEILFQVIQKGVPGGGMPGSNLAENQAWQLIAFLRALTAPASESLVPGDSSAGEALFWGEANCGRCHAIRGRGGKLGPDLTNIGGTRALPQLREAILDPDANPVPGYTAATVVLEDGRSLDGIVRNRTNYSVQFQDREGNLHLLATTQIREITLHKRSPMPNDYGKKLTSRQLQDVLAYLSRQTIR